MNSVPNNMVTTSNSLYPDTDSLQQLKVGMAKMMQTMERLEQRLNRVEQTTTQILKTQQETLQVPFMSQSELDKARQVAEQMEQDTNVAKQLQAAYNKETEVRKNASSSTTVSQYHSPSLTDCPICGVRVSQADLEVHVDNCLEMFSNDPKKEAQVRETKKKMETGFFGKFFKSTKTETTKVVSTTHQTSSATAPIPSDNSHNEAMMSMPNIYPPFGYPYTTHHPHSPPQVHPNSNHSNINNGGMPPMMMPMYMYPSYPATHMTTHLQE